MSDQTQNIIEYVENEAPYGLGLKLFPVHTFLTKLYYNLPLDEELPKDPAKQISVPVGGFQGPRRAFTEASYLKYLYEEGRCNIGAQDYSRNILVLVAGRRSGKSTLASTFVSYEMFRLVKLQDPQKHYGVPDSSRIGARVIAPNKDLAEDLRQSISWNLAKYPTAPYVQETDSYISLYTPRSIVVKGKASLRVSCGTCNAKRMFHEEGNIAVILDEVDHFSEIGRERLLDKKLSRILPTVLRPKEDGRIVLMGTPTDKQGALYERLTEAREGCMADQYLTLQLPTWEVNPTLPVSYYEQLYHMNPVGFMTDFGAQFALE
jgi:hypothetical protein